MATRVASWREEYPSARYIAPFAIFLVFLALNGRLAVDPAWGAPVWVIFMAIVCVLCWPGNISLRPAQPLVSVAIGIVVFLLWIAPDVFIPNYRQLVLFSNPVVGHTHSSLMQSALNSKWILSWRFLRAVVIVPVVEELFWRAWLMRWLIDTDFERVPLGAYTPLSFWVTAILFASEHGPYWDVGLVTGVIYNAWMIRSKSIASCILMHAVTNAALSAYVIATAQWQYWQ